MAKMKITALVGVLMLLAAAALTGLASGAATWWWNPGSACYSTYSATVTQLGGSRQDTFVVTGGAVMGVLYDSNSLDTLKIWKGNGWGSSQGPLLNKRHNHTATLLADQTTLLIAGGHYVETYTIEKKTITNQWDLDSAEIYDISKKDPSQAHRNAGTLKEPRSRHTANLLTVGPYKGRILVTGGKKQLKGQTTTAILATCELYNPADNTWAPAGTVPNLEQARYGHTATALQDGTGRIMVIGGFKGTFPGDPSIKTEIYDPQDNSWTNGPSLLHARGNHTATVLANNGRILVAGGSSNVELPGPGDIRDCEFCEKDGTGSARDLFKPTGSLITARSTHAAVFLDVGPHKNQALVVGGGTDTCELYDQDTGQWAQTSTKLPPPDVGQSGLRANLCAFLTNPATGEKRVIAVGGWGIKQISQYTTATFTFEATATFSSTPPQ